MIKSIIMVINTNIMFLQSCFLCPRTRNLFYSFQLNLLCISELVSLNVQLQFVKTALWRHLAARSAQILAVLCVRRKEQKLLWRL